MSGWNCWNDPYQYSCINISQNLRPLQMNFNGGFCFWGFRLGMLHSIILACQAFLAHHTTEGEVRHICEVTWGQAQPIENPTIHITFWERKAPAFPISFSGKAFSVSPIPNLASPKCWKDLRQDTCCLSFLSTSCKNRKISRSPFEFNIPRSPRLC